MISYPTSIEQLTLAVAAKLPSATKKDGTPRKNGKPAWLDRASAGTRRLASERRFVEVDGGDFWRELKDIFCDIQGDGKCAYCESKLRRRRKNRLTEVSRATGDIEHYRPKNGVKEWISPDGLATGIADPDCYYLLAYDLRNYLLSLRTRLEPSTTTTFLTGTARAVFVDCSHKIQRRLKRLRWRRKNVLNANKRDVALGLHSVQWLDPERCNAYVSTFCYHGPDRLR